MHSKVGSAGKVVVPMAAGAIATGLLYSIISSEAEREQEPINDILDSRRREQIARDVESAAQDQKLEEMRGATTARLHSALIRRGIVPMARGRAATATYLQEAAPMENATTGGPLSMKDPLIPEVRKGKSGWVID